MSDREKLEETFSNNITDICCNCGREKNEHNPQTNECISRKGFVIYSLGTHYLSYKERKSMFGNNQDNRVEGNGMSVNDEINEQLEDFEIKPDLVKARWIRAARRSMEDHGKIQDILAKFKGAETYIIDSALLLENKVLLIGSPNIFNEKDAKNVYVIWNIFLRTEDDHWSQCVEVYNDFAVGLVAAACALKGFSSAYIHVFNDGVKLKHFQDKYDV